MPDAKSIRDLAKVLGKSHTAVARWPKDDRWPFARTPPWSAATVEQIRTWADRTLSPNPAALTPPPPTEPSNLSAERQVKVAIGLEKLEAAKLANQAKRGELHPVAECEQRLVRIFVELRMSLLNFADGLPLDADAKEIVRGGLLGLCRRFAGEASPQAPAAIQPPPAQKPARK